MKSASTKAVRVLVVEDEAVISQVCSQSFAAKDSWSILPLKVAWLRDC